MYRSWFKVWINKLFEFYAEVKNDTARALFWGLLALASNMEAPGYVCFDKKVGYTIEQLSIKLNIDKEKLNYCLGVLEEAKVIKKFANGVIFILHWEKYQSDYQRQKPYRQKKNKKRLQQKVTDKVTGESYEKTSISISTSPSCSNSTTKELYNSKYIDKWNRFVDLALQNKKAKLEKVTKITNTRRDHLKAREKEPEFNFVKILNAVKDSDFLLGLKTSKGHEHFKASFDWIIKNDNNYIKILEGMYKNDKKNEYAGLTEEERAEVREIKGG